MWQENIRDKITQAKHFKAEFVHGWQWAGSVPHTLLRSKVSAEDGLSAAHATSVTCQGMAAASVVFATDSSEQTRPVQYFPEQQLQEDHLKLRKALIWTLRQVWYCTVGRKPKCPILWRERGKGRREGKEKRKDSLVSGFKLPLFFF